MDWKSLIKTFVSILFGFALGVFTGGGRHPWFHHGSPFGDGFVDRFARDFNLSDDQRKQAESIFADQRKKVEALHQEVFPRFEALREDTRNQIRAILSDEQKTQFDRFHSEHGEHHHGMFAPGEEHGHHEPGPPL